MSNIRIEIEIDSPNWHAHENEHGFNWIGFQPTGTEVHANQDCVVLNFPDDSAAIGVQIVMSHTTFKDFLLMVAKAREQIEARTEYEDDE